MADREERRFAEIPRESVKFMAESSGVELGDDVAALLAEDVCYRLREATQVGAAWQAWITCALSQYSTQKIYASVHVYKCSCVFGPHRAAPSS